MHNVTINGVRYVPERIPPQCGTLGETLRRLREESGTTLDVVSNEIGISKTYLWELETRATSDPGCKIVVRLADYYGVPVELLARAL